MSRNFFDRRHRVFWDAYDHRSLGGLDSSLQAALVLLLIQGKGKLFALNTQKECLKEGTIFLGQLLKAATQRPQPVTSPLLTPREAELRENQVIVHRHALLDRQPDCCANVEPYDEWVVLRDEDWGVFLKGPLRTSRTPTQRDSPTT